MNILVVEILQFMPVWQNVLIKKLQTMPPPLLPFRQSMKVNKIMMEVLSIQVLRILFVIMIFIVNRQGQGGRG